MPPSPTASVPDEGNKRILAQIERALGDIVRQALGDKTVTDIVRNADGKVWIERIGGPLALAGTLGQHDALTAINAIASWQQVTIRPEKPILSCELPDGSRFEANIPPAAVGGATFAIRKKASQLITLDQYTATGSMTEAQSQALQSAVAQHHNIIVAGATGSGKTTLANALIDNIVQQYPHERLYILEDLTEIQCHADNKVVCRATDDTPMVTLLRSALRQRPDRILIGEVRGGEAWELIKCWNTGHPGGICTIHADTVSQHKTTRSPALKRLEQLCAENPQAPSQIEIIREVITETVNLVVYIARHPKTGQRSVTTITPV